MVARSVLITTVGMLVTVGVIAAAMTNVFVLQDRRDSSTTAAARQIGSAVVSVDGLVCSACVQRLHEHLTKLPGVKTAHVDLARQAASMTFDDRVKTSDREIRAAVEAAGFRLTRVEWGQDLSALPTFAQLVIHGTGGSLCAAKLQQTLEGRQGVRSVTVDLEKDIVTVLYDERHGADLITTINKTGIDRRNARCGTAKD